MKTWKKVVLILSSIVLGISLLIGGGYLYMKHKYQQEQEYMEKVVYSDEVKKLFEEGLKNIDPKAFTKEGVIHSYKIDKSSIKHNPMGGINVTITLNNDNELNVMTIVDRTNDKYKLEELDLSSKLVQLKENKK